MGSIPNYLRTMANKFKGDVTEKVALNYLKKNGFICQRFFNINHELEKDPQEWEDHLERFKVSQKKYQAKSPPKGLEWDARATWEEYRKDRLEYGKRHIENVKRVKGLKKRLRKKWGLHLDNLAKYCKWLDDQKGYPRYPDFIAKKNDEIFVIEVKSKSNGKIAFFSDKQRKALQKARDFGLTPLLLVVQINIGIEIGTPEISEIE